MNRAILLATAALLYAPAAGAATYYVNAATGRDVTPGGGTSSAPWATLQFAAYQTHPGDTVLVSNGSYGPVKLSHSGTAGAYITYQAAPFQHPVVRKDVTAWGGIEIDGSYVTVQGFTVVGNAQSVTYVQAEAADTTNYTTNGACIDAAKGAHHVNILNNEARYCPGPGIIFWGDYGIIQSNSVHHNAYWSRLAESGIVLVGSNLTTTPGTIVVSSNAVYANEQFVNSAGQNLITDGMGIIVDSNVDTNYAGRLEIYNNIVYQNGLIGIVVHRAQHVDVYDNTTYENNQAATQAPPYQRIASGEIAVNSSTDVRVENNIFYGNPAVPELYGNGLSPVTLADVSLTWDHNILFGGQNSMPYGPSDLVLDPLFTTWLQPPSAFQVQEGSPANGSGNCALQPATDFNGNQRFPARCDRGAYYGWQ